MTLKIGNSFIAHSCVKNEGALRDAPTVDCIRPLVEHVWSRGLDASCINNNR